MSEPFLAEVRMVGFKFAPRGWAFCDGQVLPIDQNQSLYSLLGTIYGGDGRTSFALPDMRGRTPMHAGAIHQQGEKGGEETHALSSEEMPSHGHAIRASLAPGDTQTASGHIPARVLNGWSGPGTLASLKSGSVTSAGGSQAHNNMMPYLTVNFCIALQGLFPSRH